jgi:hypothetical protein
MIKTVDVIPSMLSGTVISNKSSIYWEVCQLQYSNTEGSLFYKGVVVTEDDITDTAFVNVKEEKSLMLFR